MPDGAETITDADLSRLQNPEFHFEKNLRFQSSKNNMDLNYQILWKMVNLDTNLTNTDFRTHTNENI